MWGFIRNTAQAQAAERRISALLDIRFFVFSAFLKTKCHVGQNKFLIVCMPPTLWQRTAWLCVVHVLGQLPSLRGGACSLCGLIHRWPCSVAGTGWRGGGSLAFSQGTACTCRAAAPWEQRGRCLRSCVCRAARWRVGMARLHPSWMCWLCCANRAALEYSLAWDGYRT